MKYTNFLRFSAFLATAVLVSGCSVFDFFDSDPKPNDPAKLVDIDDGIKVKRIWSVDIGDGQGDKYNRLSPVLSGSTIYAAANNGNVYAIDRNTGKRLWRNKLDDTVITGGVGVGSGLVLVGTEDSRVIALKSDTGERIWSGTVSSEVLSVPKIADGKVVVQTIDGKLQALDAENGRSLWIYESTVPALSLRGTGSPVIAGNFVIAGFGNGSVVSVALDNGTLRWEQRVAIPTGRTEIDRMVDIDGELLLNETLIMTAAYNGNLVAIDQATGQLRWRVEESSANGLATGFGNVYIANPKGHVVAFKVSQEDPVWENPQLLNRHLSAPVTFNNYVVVGDFDGYVHLISQSNGAMAGRFREDRDGVRAPMISTNDTLYILGNSGNLRAYQLR